MPSIFCSPLLLARHRLWSSWSTSRFLFFFPPCQVVLYLFSKAPLEVTTTVSTPPGFFREDLWRLFYKSRRVAHDLEITFLFPHIQGGCFLIPHNLLSDPGFSDLLRSVSSPVHICLIPGLRIFPLHPTPQLVGKQILDHQVAVPRVHPPFLPLPCE